MIAVVFVLSCTLCVVQAATAAGTTTEDDIETIFVGQTRMTASLNPVDGSVPWSLSSHGISETVYKLDKDGNLVSRFIESLTQTDDLTWAAVLKEGTLFSDGSEVNADSFSAGLNQVMEENAIASTSIAGKMRFIPIGEYELTIQTEKVTHVMPSHLCELTSVLFKNLGDGNYAFTGPYMVKSLDEGVQIEMVPNPYYPDAEKRSDVTIKVFRDPSTMQLAFESGDIEIASTITADVADSLKNRGFSVASFDAGYQYFGVINTEREFMSDPAIRQAVNLALDRDEILSALKGGRPATGIFAGYYSFAGDNDVTSDLDAAKEVLDDAGWIIGADGMREKDGEKLRLKLITYTMRPDLPIIMQVAVSQLENLGIEVVTELVDNVQESARGGDFDVMIYSQHTAPTSDCAHILKYLFYTGSVNNYSRYSNAEFDALVDKIGETPNGSERDELARQAQEILFHDLPVIYLVDPVWHIAVSDRFKDYELYCGDYYTINDTLGIA